MPSLNCIYTGSLSLGQDKLWKGESVITGLCLFTDNSSEKSQICDSTFQLLATTHLTAIKLLTFSSERYNLVPLNEESKITDFMAEIFNEEFNLCGTTQKAIIIQMSNNRSEGNEQSTNMVVYGEKDDADHSISVYAHPMIDDCGYLPVYEMTNMIDDSKETNRTILYEIFGIDHVYKHREMMPSVVDMTALTNRYTELEMMERLNQYVRDSSSDIITSAMAARKETHNRRHHIPEKKSSGSSRLIKSVPSKYIPPRLTPSSSSSSSLSNASIYQEEKKQMIRTVIKNELTKQGKEITRNKELFQQIYTSVRYCYRDIVNSIVEMDQVKLNVIVKMNVDFYNNMDNITRLL